MPAPIKLYNFPKSGHAHRIELMLSLLGLPTELIFVDLAKGEHKQPAFLAINPFGQVPHGHRRLQRHPRVPGQDLRSG